MNTVVILSVPSIRAHQRVCRRTCRMATKAFGAEFVSRRCCVCRYCRLPGNKSVSMVMSSGSVRACSFLFSVAR